MALTNILILRRPRQRPSRRTQEQATSSGGDRYPLNADEFEPLRLAAANLQAKLDRLFHALDEQIERLGLRVAAGQRGYGRDVVTLRVSLDDDIELPGHGRVSSNG